MMQFTMRTLAMITGLFGTVIAFLINILYSTFHALARVTGITANQSHFFFGLLVVLIGLIGSLAVLLTPIWVGELLLVAVPPLFFIGGWRAARGSPFPSFGAARAHSTRTGG